MTTRGKQAARRAVSVLPGDGLGYIVLYGTSNKVHLTYDQAQEVMQARRLNARYLHRPSARIAFTRAAQEIERQDEGKFVRPVVETADKKVVVIIREAVEEATEKLNFAEETRATLRKDTKTVTARGVDAKRLKDRFDHFYNFVTGDDVRQMARKVVEESDGISLRGGTYVKDAGGTYFVPAKNADRLDGLANVLEELEIGYLKAFGVVRGGVEQRSLHDTSTAYIAKEVDGIETAVKGLTTRAASARQYLARLQRLRELLQTYAALTEMTADAAPLSARLDAVESLANKKLTELSPPKESRRKRP